MPKRAQGLTDLELRKAERRERQYKLYDADGLFALIHPNGSRYWRLRYIYAGKERVLALGTHPEVSLAQARAKAAEARERVKAGIDPVTHNRETKAANIERTEATLQSVAKAWLERKARGHGRSEPKWSASTIEKVGAALNAHVLPRLGKLPIESITAPMVLDVVHAVEKRGKIEQAHRVLRWTKGIMRYAQAAGVIKHNPIADMRPSELLADRDPTHYPHLERNELRAFLQSIAEYKGRPETRIAVNILLMLAVRTGELRAAKWEEFNLDRGEWLIPVERLKQRKNRKKLRGEVKPHWVPLPRQAVILLKELRQFTGWSEYLFPLMGGRGRYPHMSENTVGRAIKIMGYKGRVVGHGFRATFSTIANDSLLFPKDVIEAHLGHGDEDKVRNSYNHAGYAEHRRKLMTWWADLLDATVNGADVVSIDVAKRS